MKISDQANCHVNPYILYTKAFPYNVIRTGIPIVRIWYFNKRTPFSTVLD